MKRYMKIVACFACVLWSVNVSKLYAFSGGPPDGRTGSPADVLTCQDGCHDSFALNTGTATFSLSDPGSYTLGETLSISISFSNSSTAKHGFELSALDANNNHVGTFSNVDGNTQTTDGNGNYIKHTSAGSSQSGNAGWNVQWTAPVSGVQDPVTFYAAGNEADGSGTNKGDYIYTTTRNITATASVTPTPLATPTPMATPTPAVCVAESVELSSHKLKLKRGESDVMTVTVTGENGCPVEGETVTAKVSRAGKKRISISSGEVTDENGQAEFTVTARAKAGNAVVRFKVNGLKEKMIVKVRKK